MRTGRFRFREDWRGRQILEVEKLTRVFVSSFGDSVLRRVWEAANGSEAATIYQALNGQVITSDGRGLNT